LNADVTIRFDLNIRTALICWLRVTCRWRCIHVECDNFASLFSFLSKFQNIEHLVFAAMTEFFFVVLTGNAGVGMYLTVERLVADGSVETSELSQVVSALIADSDRDVRYFVERVTLMVASTDDC